MMEFCNKVILWCGVMTFSSRLTQSSVGNFLIVSSLTFSLLSICLELIIINLEDADFSRFYFLRAITLVGRMYYVLREKSVTLKKKKGMETFL